MKPNLKAVLTAAVLSAAPAASFAFPFTITTPGGDVTMTEFDWSSSGQALISGYDITNASPLFSSDVYSLTYQADAANLKNGATPVVPLLGETYEYTIFAQVTETATCVADLPGGGTCDVVSTQLNPGGFWEVRFDASKDANYAAGTGFRDGDIILSGDFTGSSPSLGPQGATNPGNATLAATLFGRVLFTNSLYINPELQGTQAASTFQFGSNIQAGWVRPAAFDGVATGPNTNTTFIGQADANQSFTVPEPGSVALVGLVALVAGGLGARRKAQA